MKALFLIFALFIGNIHRASGEDIYPRPENFPLPKLFQLALDNSHVLEIIARTAPETAVHPAPTAALTSAMNQEGTPCQELLQIRSSLPSAFLVELYKPRNLDFRNELGRRIESQDPRLLDVDLSLGSGTIQFLKNKATFHVFPIDYWNGPCPGLKSAYWTEPRTRSDHPLPRGRSVRPDRPTNQPTEQPALLPISPSTVIRAREELEAAGIPVVPAHIHQNLQELGQTYFEILRVSPNINPQLKVEYIRQFVRIAEWVEKNKTDDPVTSTHIRELLRTQILPFGEEAFAPEFRTLYLKFDRLRDRI